MHIVRDRFLPYAEKLGLDILREDITFIEKSLCQLPKGSWTGALVEYANLWREELKKHEGSIKAQSYGRKAANGHLLNITRNYQDGLQKKASFWNKNKTPL
jgi:hypothetical protein